MQNQELQNLTLEEKKKFLVLKGTPAGIGSLICYTVCGLLYAELTGRIPIVLWKQRNHYYEKSEELDRELENNSFHYFFKPISDFGIKDILGKNYSYFPAGWTDENITDDKLISCQPDVNLRLPLKVNFPGSDCDVLVITACCLETWKYPECIMKSLPETHPFKIKYGSYNNDTLLYHFSRQLQLQSNLEEQWEKLYQEKMKGKKCVGLIIRKTDKARSMPSDSRYIKAVNLYLSAEKSDSSIFVTTDCAKTLEKFKNIYGEKLIYTDCIRSNDTFGHVIHLTAGNKRLKGEQALINLYLVAQCDLIIGSDTNMFFVAKNLLRNPLDSKQNSLFLSPSVFYTFDKQINTTRKKISEFTNKISKAILS